MEEDMANGLCPALLFPPSYNELRDTIISCNFEFVGGNILTEGKPSTQSQYSICANLPCPTTWSDLRMVIGMFGFYSQWLQTYEVRIHPWRELQKLQPDTGIVNLEEEQDKFKLLWTPDHTTLLNELKDDLINNMILT